MIDKHPWVHTFYYSDKAQNIIPLMLLLFRKCGILPLEGSEDDVYYCKTGGGKMGLV